MARSENVNGGKRITIRDIAEKKRRQERISVVTSYDYALASLCDGAGVDILMVGDSAGMVMLGYENTVRSRWRRCACSPGRWAAQERDRS